MEISKTETTLNCEALILGSGAGGSVIAETLTKSGLDVLMIEEGPHINPEKSPMTATESFSHQWRSGGLNAAIGNPIISYAEGRCVGGGTEINSAIMQKLPEPLIEQWAIKYQIDQFGVNEINAYFNKALNRVNASYTPQPHGKPSEILKSGGEKLGWKVKELKRAQKGSIDINPFASGLSKFGKQSMSVSLIPESIERGMRLISDCRVVKLYKKGSRITGVKATVDSLKGRRKIRIHAKYIFLCCGAIYSPTLLRSSGLSKNAGNSLQMHPTLKVIAKFPDPIDASKSHVPLFAITEFMPDIRIGGSNFTPGILGMSVAEDWENRKELMRSHKYCGIYYTMVRGTGKGKIRVMPFSLEPLVSYELSKTDWKNMALGTKYLAEVMFAAGAEQVFPSIEAHQGWSKIEEVNEETKNHNFPKTKTYLSTVHLFGSCPLGENRNLSNPLCVTDSFGKLHGYENIFVADASIIPEAPGVNPQITVMGLAYRVADAFLSSY